MFRVNGYVQGIRYIAGAGMRTTAGMQEVEQRRSSCRGAVSLSFARRLPLALALVFFATGFVFAKAPDSALPSARYMANEGLMVVQGETKVVFDPLFRNGYGQYQLLPKEMEDALFAGEPPFDGIDAVFVSHYHGDHFSPVDMLRLLVEQPDIRLYAPAQAVTVLRSIAGEQDEKVLDRVKAVELAYKDAPVTLEMEGLIIEAVRIPHSGWPTGRLDVENISWRVTPE